MCKSCIEYHLSLSFGLFFVPIGCWELEIATQWIYQVSRNNIHVLNRPEAMKIFYHHI